MSPAVARGRALRISAWALVAAGVAAPAIRRRARLPKAAVAAAAWSAHVALYEMPNDDSEALRRRVRIDYPVLVDRAIGLGELPGVRLQRRFARPPSIRPPEKMLV